MPSKPPGPKLDVPTGPELPPNRRDPDESWGRPEVLRHAQGMMHVGNFGGPSGYPHRAPSKASTVTKGTIAPTKTEEPGPGVVVQDGVDRT